MAKGYYSSGLHKKALVHSASVTENQNRMQKKPLKLCMLFLECF
jgi:hypothetical protein